MRIFIPKKFVRIVTLAGLAAAVLHAQDLRHVQPQPAPAMSTAEGEEPAPPSLAAVDQALSAQAGLKVRGLVFLAAPDQFRAGGWTAQDLPASKVDTSRVPLLADAETAQLLARFVGAAVDPRLLSTLPAVVSQLYAAHGKPFVSVTIPPQDFTSGILQVLVVAGRLGAVRVEGEKHFSEKSYLAALRAQPGQPIDAAQLDADLVAIADNPFRQATVSARPGATFGTTDLVLQASDRFPWRFYAGYDDTGNRTTGLERVNAGLNWGNVLGFAQVVNYQLTASPDFMRSVSHSANYTLPFRGGRSLSASYTYGKIQPDLPAPFDQTGRSTNTVLRFRQPLPKWGAISHALSFGADYKRSDNNLLFAEIPISGNVTHLYQLAAGYEASRPDKRGNTSFNATAYFSPGGLDDENKAAPFNASRAGADPRYAYFNLGLQRSTQFSGKFTLQTSLSAQLASTNLLGSEQFTLGGAYTVRGYDDGDTYGDWGVLLRNEFYFPGRPGLSRWFGKIPADQFTPLVFVDAGVTGPADPLPGEATSIDLASVGIGFRYAIGRYGSVRADYGWQLQDSSRGLPHSGRVHISASLSY